LVIDGDSMFPTASVGYAMQVSNSGPRELMFEAPSILIVLHDVDATVGIRQRSVEQGEAEQEKQAKQAKEADEAKQAEQAGQAETTVFGSSVVATIMRLKRGGAREFTLMNLDPSSVLNHSSGSSGSLKQVSTVGHFVRGLSVLSRLRNTLARVDNMSHALLWTSSDASMTEYCELTRVELTRLNAQFELKRGALHSLDHDGLKISDSPAPHVKGIKASFITTLNHFFQDLFGLTLFFVPRCSSLFLVVPRCSSLFLFVPLCSSLFLFVPTCSTFGRIA
jgi:hypothetical protein